MITPRADGWSNAQKVAPVIVGLGVLILVILFWWLYRVYRRRMSSRRAQDAYPGANHPLAHRRGESAASYSSTSHLNSTNASQLSLPVHRIRFFFSGMFPVRERRRNSNWNIEGDSGFPGRTPAIYDPPSRRGSDSFSTSGIHARNDPPPTSTVATWPPIQKISRWWASVNPSKGSDYQAVHLAPTRQNSKFDDDYLEAALASPPFQSQASNVGNDQIPSVGAISDGERVPVPHSQISQPEAEPTSPRRLRSLRPNRLGDIVATEEPSEPVSSPDVSYADFGRCPPSDLPCRRQLPPPSLRSQRSHPPKGFDGKCPARPSIPHVQTCPTIENRDKPSNPRSSVQGFSSLPP